MSEIGTSGVPLPPNDLVSIHDASKINKFMESPRAYLYRYIFGWVSEENNINFGFGSAMHDAMEVFAKHGLGEDIVSYAQIAFFDRFKQEFPNTDTWEDFAPKDPDRALKALEDYADHYRYIDVADQTLYTEISGSIPIRSDRSLHFKLDTLIKRGAKFISREHKTTKQMGATWENQWQNSLQVEGYNFALNVLKDTLIESFGNGVIGGVEVNGICVYMRNPAKFQRVPILRQKEHLEMFLTAVNIWIDYIERELEILSECSPDDKTLKAFPCNTASCTHYGGCQYSDICRAFANPLQIAKTPPIGYEISHWDPRRPDPLTPPTTTFDIAEGFKQL